MRPDRRGSKSARRLIGSSSTTSVRQTIRGNIGSRSTKRRRGLPASDVGRRSQRARMRSFINNIAIVASLIACGFSNSQESSPVEQKRSSLSPDKKWQYNCGEYAPGYCYPEIVKTGTTERAIAQCFRSAEPHKESGRRYEI